MRALGGPWSVRIDGTEQYRYTDPEDAHEYAREASRVHPYRAEVVDGLPRCPRVVAVYENGKEVE